MSTNKTKNFYSILKNEFPNANISISENTLQIIMSVKFDKDIKVFEENSISLFVEKYENGVIARGKNIASFVGFFPANDPRYLCLMIVDEPKGITYGSQVAAPYVKLVFEQIIAYKNIPRVS